MSHSFMFCILVQILAIGSSFPYWEVIAKDTHRGSVATYLCTGLSLNTYAKDTSGYIVGTYIISD